MPEAPEDEGRSGENPGDEGRREHREGGFDDRDVGGEVGRHRESTVERIADAVWTRPARYVEHVVTHKLVANFRRFLERFSKLDDDALATDALRDARLKAGKALEDDHEG